MREWSGSLLLRLAMWMLEPYWVPYEDNKMSECEHEWKTIDNIEEFTIFCEGCGIVADGEFIISVLNENIALKRENEALEKRYDDMASQIIDETTRGSNLGIENAALKREKEADDIRWMQIAYFVESLRMSATEGGMIAGWMDELDEILNRKSDALLTAEE